MKGKTYVNRQDPNQQRQISQVNGNVITFTNGEKINKEGFLKMYRESNNAVQNVSERRNYSDITDNNFASDMGSSSYTDDSYVDPQKFWSSGTKALSSLTNQLIQGQQAAMRDPTIAREQERQFAQYQGISKNTRKSPHVRVQGQKAENIDQYDNDDMQAVLQRKQRIQDQQNQQNRQSNNRRPTDSSLQRPMSGGNARRRSNNQMEDNVTFDDEPVMRNSQQNQSQQQLNPAPTKKAVQHQKNINTDNDASLQRPKKGILDDFEKDHDYKMELSLKIKSFSPDLIRVLQSNTKGKSKTQVLDMVVDHIVKDILSDQDGIKKLVKKQLNSEVNPRKKRS